MADIKDIDIAFLPILLPFTMSPEMAAVVALNLQPKVLYPYHTGDTDPKQMIGLLKNTPIDVRIRKMK